jgi:hypothetical protein
VSCYDAGDKHCGRCASCFKRWVALVNATNLDNWNQWGFAQHPYTWKTKDEWYNKMRDYTDERAGEIYGAFITSQEIATLAQK